MHLLGTSYGVLAADGAPYSFTRRRQPLDGDPNIGNQRLASGVEMTRIAAASLTLVDVPIRRPRRHSDGVTTSARRGILRLTSEDGVVGLGEISDRVSPDLANAVLAALPGLSIFATTRLRLHVAAGKFPVQARAVLLAGLEMALLDLQGKTLNLPVYELLGGSMRSRIPLIAYTFRTEPAPGKAEMPVEELVAEAVEEFGFATVKLKAGAVAPEEDVLAAEAVRQRFPDLPLRVDPNGIWSVSTTLRIAPRLSALGLEWLEDPVLTKYAMHQVRVRTPLPLATNMCVTSPWDLPEAVLQLPVDVVLLDLWYLGGMRNALQFQGALDAFKIDIGLHSGGGSSELGIGQAAALHLAAALPYLNFAADSMYHHLEDDIIEGGMLPIVAGAMEVPGGPGLGVAVDEDKLARYATDANRQITRPIADRAPQVYPSY